MLGVLALPQDQRQPSGPVERPSPALPYFVAPFWNLEPSPIRVKTLNTDSRRR
jgi:hypothetical protein